METGIIRATEQLVKFRKVRIMAESYGYYRYSFNEKGKVAKKPLMKLCTLCLKNDTTQPPMIILTVVVRLQ